MGDRDRSPGSVLRTWAHREVRVGALLDLLARRRIALLLGLGVLLRLAQYLADRTPWLDEGSLAENFGRGSLTALFAPLSNSQLAPPGFLLVEWVVARTLGTDPLALRLFPLLGGIASLFLFHGVAVRCLRREALWIAVGLFAVSDDLIYYASEIKQYATDVAAGLVCTLGGMVLGSGPTTRARLVGLAAVGGTVVWFSHPAAFVLAGVGTVLMISALIEGQWRRALGLSLVGLLWATSFAGVYAVSLHLLGHRQDMWHFWGFAFPPMPPSSLWEATWLPRRLVYLFVNPLDFRTPLGPRLSAVPPLILFLVGSVALGRRSPRRFGMLASPIVFALLAACLRLYPFHGRPVLFLVPALLLLIAEGAGWVGERVGSGTLWVLLLGMLFLFPTLRALDNLIEPCPYRDFNPHGDRRPAALDPARFPF